MEYVIIIRTATVVLRQHAVSRPWRYFTAFCFQYSQAMDTILLRGFALFDVIMVTLCLCFLLVYDIFPCPSRSAGSLADFHCRTMPAFLLPASTTSAVSLATHACIILLLKCRFATILCAIISERAVIVRVGYSIIFDTRYFYTAGDGFDISSATCRRRRRQLPRCSITS